GSAWKLLSGSTSGQTQVDDPQADDVAYWSHPLDVHWATKGLQGSWPKILLQVWHQDELGRCEVLGYGVCPVPATPGDHILTCDTWRPRGTWDQRWRSWFLGGGPQLLAPESAAPAPDRFRL
ncbi:B9D2 protein, partial [Brachypteracias leptosomus]|nr:B9D2 protein [Brachypteracias leptosomus]